MNRDEFLTCQNKLSILAGANQRYHHDYTKWYYKWDVCTKIGTALFALGGLSLAIAAYLGTETPDAENSINLYSVIVAACAAMGASLLLILPVGSREKEHTDLFRRWTDFRQEIDVILFDLSDGVPARSLITRLKNAEAKFHLICGEERPPHRRFFLQCQIAEENSRDGDVVLDDAGLWPALGQIWNGITNVILSLKPRFGK